MSDESSYLPGQTIFQEGSPGNAIYLVRQGSVEIWRGSPADRIVLGIIPPGGIFGEMACIDDAPRMANARAIERTVLVRIDADRVRAALARTDPIVRRLLAVILDSARRTADRLEELRRDRAPSAGADA